MAGRQAPMPSTVAISVIPVKPETGSECVATS